MKALKSDRIFCIYNPVGDQHLVAAFMARMLPEAPGSSSWVYQELKKVSPYNLTTSKALELDKANINRYLSIKGVGCTLRGSRVLPKVRFSGRKFKSTEPSHRDDEVAPMHAFDQYDPENYSVVFNGIPIEGFAEDNFIDIEFDSDGYQDQVAPMAIWCVTNPVTSEATVTFTLMSSSPCNKLLSAMYNADIKAPNGLGVGQLLIRLNIKAA